VTNWGQSLSLIYELRREITRLRRTNARLQTDRTESRAVLARVADSLERQARGLPVHSIEPVSCETSGTHGPSSRSPGA
jgi:septal ring factor EnvC (AmiA/AmiB activator)